MGVFHRQTQLEIVWDVSWTLYVGVCVLWVDVWTCGRVGVCVRLLWWASKFVYALVMIRCSDGR